MEIFQKVYGSREWNVYQCIHYVRPPWCIGDVTSSTFGSEFSISTIIFHSGHNGGCNSTKGITTGTRLSRCFAQCTVDRNNTPTGATVETFNGHYGLRCHWRSIYCHYYPKSQRHHKQLSNYQHSSN